MSTCPGQRRGHRWRQGGAALLLVLWLVVLLTAIVMGFAVSAQVEHLQGRVLVRGLVASNAARAGLDYAMTRVELEDPRRKWSPDGRLHTWRYNDAAIEVRIIDENGKLDLNQADVTVLAELLRGLGSERFAAGKLAAAIADWRDVDPMTQPAGGAEDGDYASAGRPYGAKDAEFESINELQQVLGFTPEIFAAVAPHVTVFSGRARPDEAYASAAVLDALGIDGAERVRRREQFIQGGLGAQDLPQGARSGTYSVAVRARLADGRESHLRTVVRAGGNAVPGMAYTALRWEEGVSPR